MSTSHMDTSALVVVLEAWGDTTQKMIPSGSPTFSSAQCRPLPSSVRLLPRPRRRRGAQRFSTRLFGRTVAHPRFQLGSFRRTLPREPRDRAARGAQRIFGKDSKLFATQPKKKGERLRNKKLVTSATIDDVAGKSVEARTTVCWRSRTIFCARRRRAKLERDSDEVSWQPEWWNPTTCATRQTEYIGKKFAEGIQQCND